MFFYLGFRYKNNLGDVCLLGKRPKFFCISASHILNQLYYTPLNYCYYNYYCSKNSNGDEREADTDHGTNEPGGGGEPAQGRVGRGVLSERCVHIFLKLFERRKGFWKKIFRREIVSRARAHARVPCRPSSHSSLFERARWLFRFSNIRARARADSFFRFSFSLSGFL